jgi:ligand-binding sensor domain-containing protein
MGKSERKIIREIIKKGTYLKMLSKFLIISFSITSIFLNINCKNNPVSPPINTGDTSWVKCQGLPDYYITDFAASGNNLVAGTYNALASQAYVYISFNNGIIWTLDATFSVNNHNPDNHLYIGTPVVFLVDGGELFAGISAFTGNVYVSMNNGKNWVERDTSFIQNVYSFAILGEDLFAGTGTGVFRSTDRGVSWTAVNFGLPIPSPPSGLQILQLETMGIYIFAGTNGKGIFRSSDNGESWKNINEGLTNTSMSIYGLTTIGSNIFAGVFEFNTNFMGGIFVSTNNGISWFAVNNGLTDHKVNILASSGVDLFAGTNSGLFFSSSDGNYWTYDSIGTPRQLLTIISLEAINSNLYVGTLQGAWRYPISRLTPAINTEQNKKPKYRKGG